MTAPTLTTPADPRVLGNVICMSLGRGWHAGPPQAVENGGWSSHHGHAHLHGPEGELIDMWIPEGDYHRKSEVGRIHLTGYPSGSHETGDDLHPFWRISRDDQITVAETRPAKEVAKEVERRLLPTYRAHLAEARARRDVYAAKADSMDETGRAIAFATNGTYYGGGADKRHGRNESDRRHVSSDSLDAVLIDPNRVRITATLLPDVAIAVSELIASLAEITEEN